ncbi:MAG: M43 family zinc metalloprotease, partial [Bacteroidota bacterium]
MNRCYLILRLFLLLFLIASSTSILPAQQRIQGFGSSRSAHKCGHDSMHRYYMQTNEDYKKRVQQMEARILERTLKLEQQPELKNNDTYQIPIVFHIIHASDEEIGQETNVTDAQVLRGLELLNDGFRNRGAYADDGLGAKDANNSDRNKLKSVDTNIEFVLAKQDVFGRPARGIYRYASDEFTTVTFQQTDFPMKRWVAEQNEQAFPTHSYANVYLINRICEQDGFCGNIAGYAFLADAHGFFYDGVVAEAYRFGDGKANSAVMIHEFGHYLNLRHTFWSGCPGYECDASACDNSDCFQNGDFVCDTPPDNSTRAVSCDQRANTCDSDAQSGFETEQYDLIENYMDYGIFGCFNTFTQGQKNRMRIAMEEYRRGLITSQGAVPVAGREVG